jgi:hypothetical protein
MVAQVAPEETVRGGRHESTRYALEQRSTGLSCAGNVRQVIDHTSILSTDTGYPSAN